MLKRQLPIVMDLDFKIQCSMIRICRDLKKESWMLSEPRDWACMSGHSKMMICHLELTMLIGLMR